MAEPIKFTDLIKPDDTINELIQQLRDARDAYEKLAKTVKTESTDLTKSLNATSGATEEGKQKILELAAAADKLAQAEKAVSSAIDNIQKSEKGLVQAQKEAAAAAEASVDYMEDLRKEVEKAKREAAEHAKKLQEQANAQKQVTQTTQQAAKAQKEEATEIEHAVDSYKALKKELKDLTKLFRTLSAEERIDPELGGDLAAEIRALKKELSDIDAMLTPHVSKMTELEKTEKAFAFASSDAGKQVAWLKAQIAAMNKEYISSRTALQHAIGSYDSLKATLKQLSTEYKAMSASDRQGPGGQALLSSILETKTAMSQLEAQMKPYTQALTQLEKAKQKLAYLQTNEGRELLEIRAQINAIVAERRKQEQVLTDIEKAKRKLAFARSKENRELKLYTTQIQEANRVAELRVRIANSEEGSYNRLSAQYALNKILLNQMGEADEKAAQAKRELEAETKALYQQMIELQEATGNHTLSVGNYKKVWNGLGMSVNQIVRELPAAAISLNTFFLGISNNVPILMDEIKKVRDLNAELRAEGKQTKSVIKEVTRALFSWNTVMVLLLTVFAMHGEAILEWASKLIFGKKQALSLKEALNGISEELNSSGNSYGEQVTLVQKLAEKYRALGGDIKKQEQFLKDYADDINSLGVSVTDLNDAETLFVTSTEAFITSLKLRARATAAMSLAAEEYKKELVAATKAETSESTQPSFWQGVWSMVGNYSAEGAQEDFIAQQQKIVQGFKDEAAAAKAAGDQYFDLSKMYEKMADDQLAALGLDKFTKRTKKEPKGPQPKDTEDTIESLSLSATKAYQDSITKLERDEIKKRRKEYLEAYNTEVADLARKYNKIKRILDGQDSRYKKLTEEQKEQALKAQDDIVKAIENKKEAFSQNWALLTYQKQEQDAQTQLEALNLQIEAVKSGSEEELRLRLQILRVEEQIALARNKQLPPSQQQDENVIKASFKKRRTDTIEDYNSSNFDLQQQIQKQQFNSAKHNQQQINRFTLQQEKERWDRLIALAEAGVLGWKKPQIDAAKEIVDNLEQQISDNESFIARVGERGFKGALFESFGWNEDQIDAMSQATDFIVNQFSEILAAEVALAEKEKELADERVARAQSAYEAEVEARNNGYANNVATAKKELEQEKKNQLQKQKMLEAAQKRQQAVDTIAQTSSLITASALLWKSFAGTGPAAPFLAAAAIAAMWTSFAVAKIKARQVTSAGSEEYGEGGLEFLEGGSHASGNDIDLGVNNKRRRRMRAEGGEALAIINKRRTRQYRKVLPDVIESFNKGTFEDKYLNAFAGAAGANVSIISNSSTDLSKLERDVSSIRKQNETKYFTMPDGTVIMQYKNVKRIIKN